MKTKEVKIPPIKDGIAIDHLPKNRAIKVAHILNVERNEVGMVTIGMNLQSNKLGSKDVLKIEGRDLTDKEINKIAIIAPNATVSFIKNYEVEEKINVRLPKKIDGILKCSNPRCITRSQDMKTRFLVVSKKPIEVKCHYCERLMKEEDIEIL
ncbi:aspartate carbamoyltransferase regulatory subunit [Candidatus Woesearchaeota archaeon]|nr:aspartate carbamoyltransferase regulatory subunit [Candidatus Woesearchaeota archaeon]